jgi:hypothetical protein
VAPYSKKCRKHEPIVFFSTNNIGILSIQDGGFLAIQTAIRPKKMEIWDLTNENVD